MNRMIRDLASHDRPREKLSQLGPNALNHAELMALFISTGIKGHSAIDIAQALLDKYGSMSALGKLSVNALAKEKGLGLAKASKLAAAFELGARVAKEQINHAILDNPDKIYAFFAPQMGHLPQENVIAVFVDSKLQHIGSETLFVGTINQTFVHPREVLRSAITRNAYGIILLHNHPSGDPSPSTADEHVTKALLNACRLMQVEFIDHIGMEKMDKKGYYSFREAGFLQHCTP